MSYGSSPAKMETIHRSHAPLAAEELTLHERKLQQAAKRQQTYLRQKTAAELRETLKRKALILHFEPVICPRTTKTTSANVVLRLQRQGFGLIPAEHILAMAEDSAILTEITCWIIKQILRWTPKCPQDFVFSLKVSPRQLYDYKSISRLINLLGRHHTARNHLALMLAGDDKDLQDDDLAGTLQMLAGAGLAFSIKHASHAEQTIHWLDSGFFSTLVLDKHVITTMTQEPGKDQSLLLLFEKAKSCGCKLKVTGIDSAAQFILCRDLGIDEIQGSFVGPAVPLSALPSRVQLPIEQIDSGKCQKPDGLTHPQH